MSSAGKIRKKEEIEGMEEIEETPVVEIYIRCPSETNSWQSRQATKNTTKVSSSIGVKDIEPVNTSSILWVNECEVEVLGTSGQHHGLVKRYNIQEQPTENNCNSLSTSSYKESLLERGNSGNEESSSWAKKLSESSGIPDLPILTPLRPSLWKELYFKMLKPKEKPFENLMRTSRARLKKKHVSQVQKTRRFKRIQKSVERKRTSYSRQSNCIAEVLPVNKDEPDEMRIYDLECDREDGNESSTSVSPASTRSSATSRNRSISISSDENPLESSIRGNHCDRGVQTTLGMADTGKEDVVKSRERFGWQQNKDGLFNLDLKRPGNKLGTDFGKK